MAEIISLGKINVQIFTGKFGKILTDEVIITSERIAHIQTHHPEDFALFRLYGKDCVQHPDIILSIEREYFEVEIVLLRTLWVKRNVGKGTPTKIFSYL